MNINIKSVPVTKTCHIHFSTSDVKQALYRYALDLDIDRKNEVPTNVALVDMTVEFLEGIADLSFDFKG